MSSVDNADLSDVLGRIKDLEETVENQADRIDELEAENERLREEVESREEIEFRGESRSVENLWVGNVPVGISIENASNRGKKLSDAIFGVRTLGEDEEETIEDEEPLIDRVGNSGSEGNVSAKLDEETREKLRPAHEMWMDIQADREERIPGQSKRRAARLFGRFVRRAANKSNPVDASGQTYSLTSTDARDILAEAGDMSESGRSMTTKRAMKDVQRLTKTEDCDCSGVEECTHGLIHFDKHNGKNRLYVSKTHFNQEMEDVEAAVDGSLGSDETEDVDDRIDELDSASRDEADQS